MIDKETLKNRNRFWKINQIPHACTITYKKHIFEKEKAFSSNHKTILVFFQWIIAFKTHLDLIGKFKCIGKMMYYIIK